MDKIGNIVILVVDDEVEILVLLSRYLKKRGFEVYTANCLKDGKERLFEKHPNYLFLDVNLPDGNGLKSIPEFIEIDSEVSIVLMSAYNDSEIQVDALELGAKIFLNKPFSFEEINRIIV